MKYESAGRVEGAAGKVEKTTQVAEISSCPRQLSLHITHFSYFCHLLLVPLLVLHNHSKKGQD